MTNNLERHNALNSLVGKPAPEIMAGIQSLPPALHEPMWMLADFLLKSLEAGLSRNLLMQLIGLTAADEDPPTAGASWRRATDEELDQDLP